MATINNPLGKLSGKVGDFIYRQRNGKTIISRRPFSYSKSNDPHVLARRKRFANASAISSLLSKNPAIKQLWKNSDNTMKRTAYNMMIKKFYAFVTEDDIAKEIRLSPDYSNFEVAPKYISINEETLSVTFNPLGNISIFDLSETNAEYLQMFAVVKCKDNFLSGKKPFVLLSALTNKVKFTECDEFTLFCNFFGFDSQHLVEFKCDRVIFLVLALDKDLNPVGASNTIDISIDWFPYIKNLNEKY